MLSLPWEAMIIFFIIATLYSTQGFGGGSSYLAALVLLGFSHREIPPVALTCNLVVTGFAFCRFAGAGYFEWRKALPFFIFSIPSAYFAGKIPVSREVFSFLLAAVLAVVALRLLTPAKNQEVVDVSLLKRWLIGVPVGAGIGFFSGLLGIGGGIFLSPFLLLVRWADPKQCAAVASSFIFVNSAAGLAGRLQQTNLRWDLAIPLAASAAVGGLIGSWAGAWHLPRPLMQRILAGFIFYASFKLFGIAL